jgi:hypothetical protein
MKKEDLIGEGKEEKGNKRGLRWRGYIAVLCAR